MTILGPATLLGQMLLVLLVVSGIAGTMAYAHLQSRFLAKQWAAHRELERADRVALIREAMQPAARREHPVIMVIEDNESMMALTVRQLEDQGYEVRPALSAEGAMLSLSSSLELPDMLIVDMRLPRMSGLDFVKQIRWSGCRMPIIGYSAFGSGAGEEDARPNAISAGCNDFVVKGSKTSSGDNELLVTISRWLELTGNLQRRNWDA